MGCLIVSLPLNRVIDYPLSPCFIKDKGSRVSKTEDFEYGGISYRDPREGMMVYVWKATLDKETQKVIVSAKETGESFIYYSGNNISELSFAMDGANNPAILVVDNGITLLKWFDQFRNTYIMQYFEGVRNGCITFDNKENFTDETKGSLIIAYINSDNVLCYRDALDRFNIEYPLKQLSSNIKLFKIGMGYHRRLIFQLVNTDLI